MVLSQFQILLSLTQCSPVPLLYLNEYVGFKVQIKNKHEVPDFCMIFTIFMVLSQFQILLSLTQCSPVTLLYPNEDVGFFKVQIQIKNKYEVPNFCMIFTIFMVLSLFQILLNW